MNNLKLTIKVDGTINLENFSSEDQALRMLRLLQKKQPYKVNFNDTERGILDEMEQTYKPKKKRKIVSSAWTEEEDMYLLEHLNEPISALIKAYPTRSRASVASRQSAFKCRGHRRICSKAERRAKKFEQLKEDNRYNV